MLTQKITLKRPFNTAAGVLVSELAMRECVVADMKNAQRIGGKDDAAVEVALMGIACNLLPEDIDRMSLADYKKVQKRFQQLNNDSEEESEKTGSSTGAVVSDAALGG